MGISTKFTHADLLVMPDDGKRREIMDGDLIVTPSPKFRHQEISGNIYAAFLKYLEGYPIGKIAYAPLDVILSEYDVLEPDLLFVLNEHRHIIQDWVRGAPDLVIEIVSPTTEAIDRGPKLKAYARFGVPEYWIVDPEQRAIEVYRATSEGYQPAQVFQGPDALTSLLLPGFSLSLREVFSSQ
jgi:Uma2 family endonuclease